MKKYRIYMNRIYKDHENLSLMFEKECFKNHLIPYLTI